MKPTKLAKEVHNIVEQKRSSYGMQGDEIQLIIIAVASTLSWRKQKKFLNILKELYQL